MSIQRSLNGGGNSISSTPLTTKSNGFLKKEANLNGNFQKQKSSFYINVHLLRTTVLLIIISLIIYKLFIFSMPYTTTENLLNINDYAQERLNEYYNIVSHPETFGIVTAFLIGLGFSILSCTIVHLDSNVPGVFPPSPFSPNSKFQYRRQKRSSMHLSFMTAMASGIVVTCVMLLKKQ